MEAYQQNNHSEMHKQRVRYQGNGRGPKKRYYYSPKSHWDARKWEQELAEHPHQGGLAASRLDLEEWYEEHEHYHSTQLPLPVTPELMGLAQRDEASMLQYCRKAAKRRAFPEWGVPVELTWMVLDPRVNVGDPNQLSDQIEAARIRAAEQREDEDELAMYTTLGRLKKGRKMLQNMGWVFGTMIGKNALPDDGRAKEACEQKPYHMFRAATAGLGTPAICEAPQWGLPGGAAGEGVTDPSYRGQTALRRLRQILVKCRSAMTTPLDWHRSNAFDAE